ncbi:macro domain-containing protein [Chelativorans salis]|uniref:Macro domain-containing protein n=1 Tax=Chelativorans salis TaxID=2978478 RepID=A0ABT2LGN4_9HYPH|nr:macro domain-containing protein [Chelativorans sp. EGI FJ00035]MCT7373670.1 macro domain-containing protein [Chelativorans sp. EGI FJ00035]
MRIELENAAIEIVVGDITEQRDMDAIVNAANAELMSGGGVAGAIHRKAGPELAQACRPLAPIRPGEAVITGSFRLPNTHVIHCLGPIYGVDKPEAELLARCYASAIALADTRGIGSLAFPALSTGAFSYPVEEAAPVACAAVAEALVRAESMRVVRHVLTNEALVQIFAAETSKAVGRRAR